MGELSIKISIANRTYPLKINMLEEESVRKAVKLINEKIKEYENSYSVKDMQDLLAMCALQYATEAVNNQTLKATGAEGLNEILTDIDVALSDCLSN